MMLTLATEALGSIAFIADGWQFLQGQDGGIADGQVPEHAS